MDPIDRMRLAALEKAIERLAPGLLLQCRAEAAAEMEWHAREQQRWTVIHGIGVPAAATTTADAAGLPVPAQAATE